MDLYEILIHRRKTMKEKQKWLILDGDDGWQIVVPNIDDKPHGFPKGTNKTKLAGEFCPCAPKIDHQRKIIIHNSFIDIEAIEKSIDLIFPR